MQCLNCNTLMKVMHYKDVEFDRCPQCDAHWFDMGELQTIFQHMGSLFSEKQLVNGVKLPNRCRWCETQNEGQATQCVCCDEPLAHQCPRDHHVMYHTRFGPVEIDICPGCRGLWFDGDEFRALVEATQASPSPRAFASATGAQVAGRRAGGRAPASPGGTPARSAAPPPERQPVEAAGAAEPSPELTSVAGLPTATSVPGIRGVSESGLATSAGQGRSSPASSLSSRTMFGAAVQDEGPPGGDEAPARKARSAPSGPCQICGELPEGGGPLQWEHGFWKCAPCFGPEDPNESERLDRLRARNERLWRGRARRERVVSQLTEDASNALDILPNWLSMLGSWLTERADDGEGAR